METGGPKPRPLLGRSKLLRVLKGIAVAVGFVFLVAVGLLIWALETGKAVELVREELLTTLHDACGVEAEFTSLALNTIDRELDLVELKMRHLDGRPLLSVEQALVSVQLIPLLYGRVELDRVALLGPQATIELADGRMLNLPRCLAPSSDRASASPLGFGISDLRVERGRFTLRVDDTLEARLGDININLASGRSGGVDVSLATNDGEIELQGRRHPLHKVRLLGHVEGPLAQPRALVVDAVEIALGRVTVSGNGGLDLLGPVYEARLEVAGPLEAAREFVDGLPDVAGDLRVEVSLAGSGLQPRGLGKVVLERGRVTDIGFGDRLEVELRADPSGAEITRLEVLLGQGRVVGRGTLGFGDGFPLRIESEAQNISMARVLDNVGIYGAWIDFRATGTSVLAGKLDPLGIEGPFDYLVEELVVFDRAWDHPSVRDKPRWSLPEERILLAPKPVEARGTWRFDPTGISFRESTVESGSSLGHADVHVDFDGERGGPRIAVQFPRLDMADLGPIAGLTFGGQGTLAGELGGTFSSIGAAGTLDFRGVTIAGIPFGDATAELSWRNFVDLEVSGIQGRLADSRYRGRVAVHLADAYPLTIEGAITEGRLEDLLIPFGLKADEWGDARGQLAGTFSLTGPIRQLTGPVDLELASVEVFGEKAEKGRALGRFDRGVIVVEELELEKRGALISGSGSIDPVGGRVRARVRTTGAMLQDLDLVRGSQEHLDGKLALRLSLAGTLRGVTGTVSASLSELTAGPMRLGGGEVRGKVRGTEISLGGGLFGGAMSLEGRLKLAKGLPYQAELGFVEVALPRIAAGLRGHQDWRGNTTLRASLSGSLVDWHLSSGVIQLDRAELNLGGVPLETAQPARLELERGVLSTKRLSIAGPRTRLTASGRLGAKVIDLEVNGRVDLELAQMTSPSVEKSGGTLFLDGAVGGRPSAMNLVGTGRIDGAFLQWRGIESRLTGVSADLTFSQSSVLIDRSSGRWAGGQVTATGQVILESFRPKSYSLLLNAVEVRPRFSWPKLDLTGLLDGRLLLQGTPERLGIRGDLEVRRGRANPKLDWASLVGSRRGADVYDPAAEVVDFDIAFRTAEPIRVKNDDADLELRGELRLTGTNERWGMLGAASVNQGGRVLFLGREYVLETGAFELRDRFRFYPHYDLILFSDACGARVRLNVVGTLDKVETSYSSNPEMDERDIVSCLVRGMRVRDLDQDLPSFASSALLKLSGVDREVKKVLPVDQIDVTTEYSSQARAYEPRVLVAKDLSVLERPARLEYSSSLLRTNDQRAAIRVRLSPRLNLQLGWTSSEDVPYGDWGLDLKQRWEW